MKSKSLLLIILILLILSSSGCGKDDLSFVEGNGIVNYADPATDGCGWSISIDQKDYHPTNLNNDFKVDGLYVKLKYRILQSTWTCTQWTNRLIQEVEIISIHK